MPEGLTKPTILVVEDDPSLSGALAALLKSEGYATVVANTGSAGLKYAAEHAPLVVILDIHLPDIHGLILSQKLRDLLGPAVPLIILSGDSSMEVINSLSHVGATHFFRKPVESKLLVKQLAELLIGIRPPLAHPANPSSAPHRF